MRQKIKTVYKHPLISGSLIVFIGSFVANIFNYFFNLAMGRMLTVEDYGLLSALVSVWVFFAIFQTSFTGILAKFTANYAAVKDKDSMHSLFYWSLRNISLFCAALFVLLLIFIQPMSSFLHIDSLNITLILYLMIIVSILQSVPVGVLQGEMRFLLISSINISSPILKITLALTLVILGYGIFGALIAVLLSAIIPFTFVLLYIMRELRSTHMKKLKTDQILQEVKGYSTKFFLATLGVNILSHGDMILVRHFFEPVVSGQYAALSLMGKAIFYLTGPISFVLFPLIAQKKAKSESVFETILLASFIVMLFSTTLSFIYFMFPGLVLQIFFPAEAYQALKPYLGPYSLFIIIFSMVYLLNNYFLSSGKMGIYKVNLLSGAFMIILFIMFHNSLYQVIGVLFATSLLTFIGYLVYYKTHGKD